MKEGYMKSRYLALIITGTMLLGACATSGDEEVAPAAPVGAGAIVGTVAAARDGDGMVDGYYTSAGIYPAFQAPPCPPTPPQPPSPSGERGRTNSYIGSGDGAATPTTHCGRGDCFYAVSPNS